jgi:hypothetical protein
VEACNPLSIIFVSGDYSLDSQPLNNTVCSSAVTNWPWGRKKLDYHLANLRSILAPLRTVADDHKDRILQYLILQCNAIDSSDQSNLMYCCQTSSEPKLQTGHMRVTALLTSLSFLTAYQPLEYFFFNIFSHFWTLAFYIPFFIDKMHTFLF